VSDRRNPSDHGISPQKTQPEGRLSDNGRRYNSLAVVTRSIEEATFGVPTQAHPMRKDRKKFDRPPCSAKTNSTVTAAPLETDLHQAIYTNRPWGTLTCGAARESR